MKRTDEPREVKRLERWDGTLFRLVWTGTRFELQSTGHEPAGWSPVSRKFQTLCQLLSEPRTKITQAKEDE